MPRFLPLKLDSRQSIYVLSIVGTLLLWQIHSKNVAFSKQLAEQLDLNDGINVKEAKALKTIYEWIRDVEFPSNFPDKNQTVPKSLGTYIVDMSWTSKNLHKWRIGVVVKGKNTQRVNFYKENFEDGSGDLFVKIRF